MSLINIVRNHKSEKKIGSFFLTWTSTAATPKFHFTMKSIANSDSETWFGLDAAVEQAEIGSLKKQFSNLGVLCLRSVDNRGRLGL
jgi:hypothetical protein